MEAGMPERSDPSRLQRIQASARARAQLPDVDETQDEVEDAVRAILARAAPPGVPDPLTGRVVGRPPADPGPLTAAQLHRRIMAIARLAGRIPPE